MKLLFSVPEKVPVVEMWPHTGVLWIWALSSLPLCLTHFPVYAHEKHLYCMMLPPPWSSQGDWGEGGE